MTTILSAARSGAEPVLGGSMYRSRLFAATLASVILVTLGVAAYTYGGAPLFVTATTASVAAFLGWLGTTYRRPASRPVALELYVATVVALMVLYGEQWYRGFSSRLMALYPGAYPPGVGITDHAFVAVFPLAGSALLLLGALTYYHGTAFGRFAAWFTFAWGAIDALAVYVYPLFAGGRMRFLPGAITAPLPLLISLLGTRALVRREGTSSARRTRGVLP
jgi:hypothetical protein